MIGFFNPYQEFSADLELFFKSVVDRIVKEYGLSNKYVNIIFLTDEELFEMNMSYLNHDYYTDIITFNYAETPKDLEAELYISLDRVIENASINGVIFEEELLRVIVHGMLHLAGFEDSSEVKKADMRIRENSFMNGLSFHVKPSSY